MRKPIHKRISSGNRSYLATYMAAFPGRPPDWMICFLMDEADLYRESRRNLLRNMAAVAIGLALAIGASMWISVLAVKPIERVTALAGKLERLEVEETDQGKASAIREVDDLRRAIGRAAIGLKSFLKYVPQELLKGYMSSGKHAHTDGMLREVSIAFIDIRDYSTVSERLEPMELVTHLNAFLEEVCSPIISRSGTIDKFIGDSVMAFWNAPGKIDGHPAKACEAMLDCLARVSSAAKAWKASGLPAWEPCVGIHTGEVIVGNIGSSSRLNYTIIGDVVNLTSRLESLNRIYGTSILITEATRDKAGKRFITRPVDLVAVKGKSVPVLIHELMGEREVCRETLRELADSTAKAHAKLANREFTRARLAYQAIMAAHPADVLSLVMAERCAKLEMDPPPADWSGVFRYNTK